jgi:DNA invertase Pin-like site-specific DNA recombinase
MLRGVASVNYFVCDTRRKCYFGRMIALSEQETKLWTQLTELLSKEWTSSMLHPRTREEARKRAAIWRELVMQGVSQAKIARAFGVSRQAVSKAIRRKRSR